MTPPKSEQLRPRTLARGPCWHGWAFAVCTTAAFAAISVFAGDHAPSRPFRDATDARSEASDAIRTGAELERSGRWADAVRHYRLEKLRFPADDRILNGLRRSEFHLEIGRRYSDSSFTTKLLSQNPTQAFAAFERVHRHVRDHYFEPLSVTSLTAHGTESLYLALADDDFVNQNLPSADRLRITALRRSLKDVYWNRRVEERDQARRLVEEVARHCNREVGLRATAVVWEYACGSTHALDDYSGFLTPDGLRDFNGRIEGGFVGIGVEVTAEHGYGARLLEVFPSSPAERAGLQRGEAIVAVGETDCRQMPMQKITQLLLGPDGSTVELSVAQAQGSIRSVRVTRSAFAIPSVVGVVMLDGTRGIGYLRMTAFQRKTPAELDAALADLTGQGLQKLIWDLRGNAGGLLPTAIAVADRFLADGTIVSMRGRNPDQNVSYSATPDQTDVTAELVILIDEESASASEIIAAAMRDLGRARLVGRKSFGKWCLQTVFPFSDGTGMRLTTAMFFSPYGLSYDDIGLSPDVFVPRASDHLASTRATDLLVDPDVQAAMKLFGGATADVLVTGFRSERTLLRYAPTRSAPQPLVADACTIPSLVNHERNAAPAEPVLQAAAWPALPHCGRGEYR